MKNLKNDWMVLDKIPIKIHANFTQMIRLGEGKKLISKFNDAYAHFC